MIENILLLFTGTIGIITILSIISNFSSNRISNIYLILTILLTSFRYIINGYNLIDKNSSINNILDNFKSIQILIYPFLYLYFKKLICNNKPFQLIELNHFIPLFLLTIINRIISNSLFSESITIYYIYTLFFLLYTLFYLYITYQLLQKKIWKKNGFLEIVIKQNKLIKEWSMFLFLTLFLISIRNIILILLTFFSYHVEEDYSWISEIIFLMLFLKILITPEILYGYNFLLNKINKENRTDISIKTIWDIESRKEPINLQDSQLKGLINEPTTLNYIKKIDNSILNEYFKDSGFSAADFANELNIPKSHLNYIFKYHCKISFIDFKKIARIQYSLKLIDDDFLINNTLEVLSKKVGFLTYNTFFISFKDITGINPIEYSKNKETITIKPPL